MKKIIIFTLVIVLILLGIYLRPSDGQPQDVNSVVTPEGESVVYELDQGNSIVQFEIDEVLRGNDFRVVGTTKEIEGQVSIEGSILNFSEVSVGADSFQTDSSNRDGAIRNFILQTNKAENKLITLKNISSSDFELGKSFSIKGDLFISGISREVALQAEVLSLTDDELSLSISGQVLRSDYSLTIPDVPFVASVGQAVDIKADLVFKRLD